MWEALRLLIFLTRCSVLSWNTTLRSQVTQGYSRLEYPVCLFVLIPSEETQKVQPGWKWKASLWALLRGVTSWRTLKILFICRSIWWEPHTLTCGTHWAIFLDETEYVAKDTCAHDQVLLFLQVDVEVVQYDRQENVPRVCERGAVSVAAAWVPHKPRPNPSWLFNSILILTNLLAHGGTGALALWVLY